MRVLIRETKEKLLAPAEARESTKARHGRAPEEGGAAKCLSVAHLVDDGRRLVRPRAKGGRWTQKLQTLGRDKLGSRACFELLAQLYKAGRKVKVSVEILAPYQNPPCDGLGGHVAEEHTKSKTAALTPVAAASVSLYCQCMAAYRQRDATASGAPMF